MEPKKRLMIVVAVTILILGAIFASFGRSFFSLKTTDIVLPGAASASDPTSNSQPEAPELHIQRVEITPDTVQAVIATLERSDSFYRELTVETFWSDTSTATQIQVWTDNGWSHSRQVLPYGTIRHDLIGSDTLYYWYDGSPWYLTAAADDQSADLSQRIPTYETILSLSPESISDAGYGYSGDYPCIFVEATEHKLDLLTRFWVSVDTGLLVSAEQMQGDQVVYRMTSYGPVQSPCPSTASFSLPDGTVLHEIA